MTDITTAIEAEIATLDAALAEMTARRVTLMECRTLLTAKVASKPPETASTAPRQAVTSRKATRPAAKRQRARGERHSLRANLSADDIEMIREGAANKTPQTEIASWFDGRISRSTISNIVRGKGCYANM